MSRASELRDAVIIELAAELSCPVIACVIPNFEPEELADPLLAVRIGSRILESDMGPDRRQVILTCGVFGAAPDHTGFDVKKQAYRAIEVKKCDEFDDLVEQAIALWAPDGPLSKKGLADHRFVSLTQDMAYDGQHYYDNGIWVGPFTLSYFDTFDD